MRRDEKSVWENESFFILVEESIIPWLKIFTKDPYGEMSDVPQELRYELYSILHVIEKEMISYYKPQKINIASFGNYLPRVHWHIMARFSNDSHFPEPMWGKKQRNPSLELPEFKPFMKNLLKRLKTFE